MDYNARNTNNTFLCCVTMRDKVVIINSLARRHGMWNIIQSWYNFNCANVIYKFKRLYLLQYAPFCICRISFYKSSDQKDKDQGQTGSMLVGPLILSAAYVEPDIL